MIEHAIGQPGNVNGELDERFIRKQGDDYVYNRGDFQEDQPQNEEEVIVGDTGEGDGPPIMLQKVMIQDLNQEFLMDEAGNLYDMEGHYVGKVDEGAEEGEEGEEGEGMEGGPDNEMMPDPLPEIPPVNQHKRQHQAHDAKKRPQM